MSNPDYPIVRCTRARHRKLPDASGYMVCVHVARHERPIAVHQAPTESDIGVIVCAECDEALAAHQQSENLVSACVYCVTENNLIPS